jgi:hypothetical protein
MVIAHTITVRYCPKKPLQFPSAMVLPTGYDFTSSPQHWFNRPVKLDG